MVEQWTASVSWCFGQSEAASRATTGIFELYCNSAVRLAAYRLERSDEDCTSFDVGIGGVTDSLGPVGHELCFAGSR